MLEQYFVKPTTIDRIRACWLGEPIERYVAWLHEHGYSACNVYRRVPVLMHFAAYSEARGAGGWEGLPGLVEPFVEQWLAEHGRRGITEQERRQVASEVRNPVQQLLRLLLPGYTGRRREALPQPFADQAPGFFNYLREERGLRETTIDFHGHHLRCFETYLKRIERYELGALSPTILGGFVTDSGRTLCKSSLKGRCESVRVFLRYLHRERVISRDLSRSLDAPRLCVVVK